MVSGKGVGGHTVSGDVGGMRQEGVWNVPSVNARDISAGVMASSGIEVAERVVQVVAVEKKAECIYLRIRGASGWSWEGRPVQVRVQNAIEISSQEEHFLVPAGRNCSQQGFEKAVALLLVRGWWCIDVNDVEAGLHVLDCDGSCPAWDKLGEGRGGWEGGATGVDGHPVRACL